MPGLLAAAAQLVVLQESTVSLDARAQTVRDAVWKRNEQFPDRAQHWFPHDVFEDFVIVRNEARLMKVPYTLGENGKVQFGEAEKVQVEYVPVRVQESSDALAQLIEAESDEVPGLEWDVTIIRAGHSENGYFYPVETLKEAVPLFEGISVYAFMDDGKGHKPTPAEKAPKYLAGWIDGVKYSNNALVGRLHLLRESSVDLVRVKLVDAWKRGKRDLLGLSIDARGKARPAALVEGKKAHFVETFVKALSVDIVVSPAAGGAFTRLVASAADDSSQEGSMTLKQRLWKLLESRRPDALAGLDQNTVTIEKLEELLGPQLLQEAFAGATNPSTTPTTSTQPEKQPAAQPQQGAETLQEVQRGMTQIHSARLLQESRLPEVVQKRLAKRFENQILSVEAIQAAIDEERGYLAQLAPARVTVPGGGARVEVGAEKLDRLQAAFDRACGLEPEKAELKTIAPIGLRRLYDEITLGADPDVQGQLQESAVNAMLQEAFTNATLPRVVANTLHRRLLRDYRAVDYAERRIITVRPGVSDFKTQEAVRIGYLGDLSTVDPEVADYQEIAAYGEESATYAVGQRGNLLTITRKHIKNDDVGHVAKVVGRLGRAARRTFANFVWNFPIANAAIYDTVAYFHATHGNLGATALSVTSLNAAELAMFNQVELSSGKKLGLKPKLLSVPIELKATAIGINQSPFLPGSANNDANPWYHAFGANNENIHVNPFQTDANDWILFADVMDGDIIEVAFMDGNEEPELFLADTPTVGQMFLADKLQYKIRHEYGGAVTDFRTAYKAVVA